MKLLLDPRIFSFVIMALYLMNMVRWAFEKKWADVVYWFAAFLITATVTFGYKH
jgi:hypothetical protein